MLKKVDKTYLHLEMFFSDNDDESWSSPHQSQVFITKRLRRLFKYDVRVVKRYKQTFTTLTEQ